jgi:ferric-dicitrate binding protein FerR (iron transport regulator)
MQTDATVARIVWAAERRETWTTLDDDHEQERQAESTHRQPTAPAEKPEVDYAAEFARLRSEVETAESRRQAWSLLGALALLAAIVGAGMALIPMLPNLLAGVLGG